MQQVRGAGEELIFYICQRESFFVYLRGFHRVLSNVKIVCEAVLFLSQKLAQEEEEAFRTQEHLLE